MSGGVRGRRQKPSPTRSNQLRYTREENCVCLDAHEMKPVLLDDIIEEVKDKRIAYEENIL